MARLHKDIADMAEKNADTIQSLEEEFKARTQAQDEVNKDQKVQNELLIKTLESVNALVSAMATESKKLRERELATAYRDTHDSETSEDCTAQAVARVFIKDGNIAAQNPAPGKDLELCLTVWSIAVQDCD
jgi:hypothetical protein